MVDAVPQSGVPANSVHTGGRSDDVVGRDGSSEDSVGIAGSDGSSDDSVDRPLELVAAGVVVFDDAPALATPTPNTPSDNEAPISEAASTR